MAETNADIRSIVTPLDVARVVEGNEGIDASNLEAILDEVIRLKTDSALYEAFASGQVVPRLSDSGEVGWYPAS